MSLQVIEIVVGRTIFWTVMQCNVVAWSGFRSSTVIL